jgi:hypothetical protein
MTKNDYKEALLKIAEAYKNINNPDELEKLSNAALKMMTAYATHLQLAGTFQHAMDLFDPDKEYHDKGEDEVKNIYEELN